MIWRKKSEGFAQRTHPYLTGIRHVDIRSRGHTQISACRLLPSAIPRTITILRATTPRGSMTCAVRSPKAMMMIENAKQGRMYQVRHSKSPRQAGYVLQGGPANALPAR